MITKQVIDNIYKAYPSRPESPDELNLGVLFCDVFDSHQLGIDEDKLVINTIDPVSPFHEIPLRNIHEIVDFDDHVAVVLHSSIIFLKKESPEVHIHVRQPSMSIGRRLLGALRHDHV